MKLLTCPRCKKKSNIELWMPSFSSECYIDRKIIIPKGKKLGDVLKGLKCPLCGAVVGEVEKS